MRKDKLSQLPQRTHDALCKRLQNEETDYETTKRLAMDIDCSASLKSAGVSIILCALFGNISQSTYTSKVLY